MRILIDFFPIALFVAFYKLQDIYTATAVLMAATVMQTGLIYAMDKRLQMMQKVTLALVLVFGVLTLVLQDERFIKWKPTVLYISMALVLAAALWIWKKNFLQILLSSQLQAASGHIFVQQGSKCGCRSGEKMPITKDLG